MRASRGLKWKNKMYKLKRSILRWISPTHQKHHSSSQKVYLQPKPNLTTLPFHQKLLSILHQLFVKTVDVDIVFHCSDMKTILIYFTISM